MGAEMDAVVGPVSFWRVVDVPFGAWLGALERWQLTGPGGELRLGRSVVRGPAERDQHFGTCRIQVRLGRGPLRPPVGMRLDIDHWSPTATALALIPRQRARPGAASFRAGRTLLDTLTHALPEHSLGPQPGGAPARQPPAPPGGPRAVLAGASPPRPAALARPAPAHAQESATAGDTGQLPRATHLTEGSDVP